MVEDSNQSKTNIYDVLIKAIETFHDFAIQVINSEKITLTGKVNLLMVFITGIIFIFLAASQSIDNYGWGSLIALFLLAIISTILSGTSYDSLEKEKLKNA